MLVTEMTNLAGFIMLSGELFMCLNVKGEFGRDVGTAAVFYIYSPLYESCINLHLIVMR